MQLDIFNDSRDVMLRNDVLDALQRRQAGPARAAWQALAGEAPDDPALAALTTLIDALERDLGCALADHAALRSLREGLMQAVEPAARQMLGAGDATAWLAPLWRQLAEAASALPFRADAADDHAAPLCLRAADWAAAARAVDGIESWRRIPAPLAWMAEARCRADGIDAAWPLLAELAWLAPARFGALEQRLADPLLRRLRRRFDAEFEGAGDATADLAWWPAWVLTDSPVLARHLGEAQPGQQLSPERALRLMLDLLSLERQGRHHDLIDRRKRLRDLHAGLYRAYMATR